MVGEKKKPQQQDRWSREEQVLLVVEYYRVKECEEEEKNRSNRFISEILRRRAAVLGKEIDIAYRDEWGIKRQRIFGKSREAKS